MNGCSIENCDRPYMAKGYCNAHYQSYYKYGDPIKAQRAKTNWGDTDRFIEDKVLSYDSDECLLWPFALNNRGYGLYKGQVASRYICSLFNGEPFEGAEAAHSCGNGHLGCVNPKHLRWATTEENLEDRKRHGRMKTGEAAPQSKLTLEQVREIRSLKGVRSGVDVAKMFHVRPGCITRIWKGQRWKHDF